MSEVTGQMSMSNLYPTAEDIHPESSEGYDERGNLLAYPVGMRLDILAGEINLLENQAKDMFKRTAIEIGARLLEARNLVARGRFEEWLKKSVNYSVRKAQQLMQVAEAYDGKALPEAYDKLSFTQIYDLLSAPEESRDALAEAAAEEGMSTRQLKAEIDRLNEALKDQAEDHQERMALEVQTAWNDGAQAGREESLDSIKALRVRMEKAEEEAKVANAKATAAEASMKAIRDTAAKANDRAADEEQRARDAITRAQASDRALKAARDEIAALKKANAAKPIEVVPAGVELEMKELRAQIDAREHREKQLLAELSQMKAARAAEDAGGVEAAMARAKSAITEAVSAIKAAPAEAGAKAKNELMVICTAIAKKLGGMQA